MAFGRRHTSLFRLEIDFFDGILVYFTSDCQLADRGRHSASTIARAQSYRVRLVTSSKSTVAKVHVPIRTMLSATPTREALASIAPLAMRSIRCSAPRAGSVANALAGRRAIATSPNLPHPTYPSCRIAGGSSLLSGHHSRHCLSSRPISSTSSCHGQQPSSASGASTDTPAQDKLTRPCPSCSAPIPLPASPCPECATLLPLRPDLSLHSLLDLSAPVANSDTGSGSAARVGLDIPAELATVPALGFDLQPRSLRNTMLFRQRDLHPDKYGSSGAEAVELAKELSGRVNGAYAVLADPLRRAEYIVCLFDTSCTVHLAMAGEQGVMWGGLRVWTLL